jgi:hypothetical protein
VRIIIDIDTGCSYTVGDFGCFQGFPETLPLEELAIGMGESCWSMFEMGGRSLSARLSCSYPKRLQRDG